MPAEPTEIVFTRIPIPGIPEFRCNVHVTDDGRALDADGDPIPMERRPFECGRDGQWLMGMQPLCESHFREACRLAEFDPDEIEAEWRAQL